MNNILDFEKDWPEAKVIRLEENYRSVPDILECANAVIKNNKKRKEKRLWTANESDESRVIVQGYSTDSEEAYYIGREIEQLIEEEGYDYNDFVILYRTNAQSRNFEEQFARLKIPFKSVGSLAFYERAEIKDLMAYLSLLVNDQDDLSFMRIVNTPKRKIGAVSLQRLVEYASFKGYGLYQALADVEDIPTLGRAKSNFRQFYELMENLKLETEDLPIDEKIRVIYERSGYEEMLKKDKSVQSQSRQENIKELIQSAKSYRSEGIEAFLENAALSSTIDELDDSKKVTLMTIHSAKGLEYPVVFLTGMEQNLFPSYQSIQKKDIEEERRLCYVGITRAKERLFLTYAKNRYFYGSLRQNRPSEFLKEIPKGLVKKSDKLMYNQQPDAEHNKRLYKVDDFIHPFEEDLTIRKNDNVRSKVFGEGKVIEVEGNSLTVLFPGVGIKIIAQGYVEKV